MVAINRATGYMGTQRVQLKPGLTNGDIGVKVEEIKLKPINLRVWADRTFDVKEGKTAHEVKTYLIGA